MELWCQQIEHLPSFISIIAFAFQMKVFPPYSWFDKSKTVIECRVEGCMPETRCFVWWIVNVVFLFCYIFRVRGRFILGYWLSFCFVTLRISLIWKDRVSWYYGISPISVEQLSALRLPVLPYKVFFVVEVILSEILTLFCLSHKNYFFDICHNMSPGALGQSTLVLALGRILWIRIH